MNSLSNLAKGAESKADSDHPAKPDHHEKPSTTDLFGSAKLVAEAAQSHLRHEPESYDKGKVANAAADLLDGASDYGKLDASQGFGKYVDQAENYLRQYGTSHSTTTTTATAAVTAGSGGEKTASVESVSTTTVEPVKEPTEPVKEPVKEPEKEHAAGGAGDYLKIAEGFLGKNSGGSGEGGAGDLLKTAGSLFGK